MVSLYASLRRRRSNQLKPMSPDASSTSERGSGAGESVSENCLVITDRSAPVVSTMSSNTLRLVRPGDGKLKSPIVFGAVIWNTCDPLTVSVSTTVPAGKPGVRLDVVSVTGLLVGAVTVNCSTMSAGLTPGGTENAPLN